MTSIKNKIENISESIQNINEILNSFSDYEQIPNIDIDLLKDKLRKVYDDINTINKIDEEPKAIIETVENNVVIEQELVEEKTIIEDDITETNDEVIEETSVVEEEIVDEYHVIEEEKEEFVEVKEEIVEEIITPEPEIIKEESNIDLSGSSDVKDIIAEFKNATDLASQLQFKSIDDINNAVSINDKIGFINDIFGGDADSYVTCISKLNNTSDLNNAVNILDESQKWDKENPVHKKFIELVFRKFVK